MSNKAPDIQWTEHLDSARFWRAKLVGANRITVERTTEVSDVFRTVLMRVAEALYGDHALPPDLYPAAKPENKLRRAGPVEVHQHAFFLPEDLGADGYISHIAVASPRHLGGSGLSRKGLALLNLCQVALSVQMHWALTSEGYAGSMARKKKPDDPFRWFDSSPKVIRLVVMMYVRYPLSLRNVEHLLFERGIDICHETVRLWWNRFGPMFAGEIRRKRVDRMRAYTHWKWRLDEVYVRINGEMHYLWRAVDHEGEVLESFVTKTRDKAAALKFIKKAMKRHGRAGAIVTDGLRSYGAALKDLGAADRKQTGRRWLNNRVENSHLPFRRRERAMLRFRRMKTLQKFASVHGSVHNHFQQERHLVSREIYKQRRSAALAEWRNVMG